MEKLSDDHVASVSEEGQCVKTAMKHAGSVEIHIMRLIAKSKAQLVL